MSSTQSLGGPTAGLAHKPTLMAKGAHLAGASLGIVELVAPRAFNALIGAPTGRTAVMMTRLMGARELAQAGLMTKLWPAKAMTARVVGDGVDLAMLTAASRHKGADTRRLSAATAAAVMIGVTDVVALRKNQRNPLPKSEVEGREYPLRARTAVTINKPISEVYSYWHQFEQLPTFMYHLESVTNLGEGRSHWKAKGPLGKKVEWDAEIIKDDENQVIAWHSLPGATVDNTGRVEFREAPGGRGTEVFVEIDYSVPGGGPGALIAKLFGEEPEQQIKDDLRRFKQIMETGEVLRSDGSPEGTLSRRQFIQRDAQPMTEKEAKKKGITR